MPLCMSFPYVSLQAYIGEVVHEDNFFYSYLLNSRVSYQYNSFAMISPCFAVEQTEISKNMSVFLLGKAFLRKFLNQVYKITEAN